MYELSDAELREPGSSEGLIDYKSTNYNFRQLRIFNVLNKHIAIGVKLEFLFEVTLGEIRVKNPQVKDGRPGPGLPKL